MENTEKTESTEETEKTDTWSDLESEKNKDTVYLIKLHPDASTELADYLTISQAAEILGIKSRALRERLRRRRVPVMKVGYFSLIRREDLERLV